MKPEIEQALSLYASRGFDVKTFSSAAEMKAEVLRLVPDGCSAGFPGSVTCQYALRLPEALEEKGCRIFSHWRTPVSRDPEIFYKENAADAFFTSCNAITLDGEILNMDGFGNRLSGLCYGPKEVFILCGVNKFVKDRAEGMERIYHTAFPLNSQRLHGASPCASDGKCRYCPAEVCKKSGYLLSLSHPAQGRTYHLFVADEPLGF